MRTDGPAAPTEKDGAKPTEMKALLDCVNQRSAAPAPANKYRGVIDWAEDVASIGDEFDELVKKAKRLGDRQHLSDDEGKELAATVAGLRSTQRS